jgi:hypothetical protein
LVVGEKGNTLSLCGKKLQMCIYLLLSEIEKYSSKELKEFSYKKFCKAILNFLGLSVIISSSVIIISWFLFKLSNSPFILAESLLRKPLPIILMFPVCPVPDQTPETSAEMPREGSVPI